MEWIRTIIAVLPAWGLIVGMAIWFWGSIDPGK